MSLSLLHMIPFSRTIRVLIPPSFSRILLTLENFCSYSEHVEQCYPVREETTGHGSLLDRKATQLFIIQFRQCNLFHTPLLF